MTTHHIGMIMGGTILLFMLVGAFIMWRKDEKKWNKGVCDSCYKGVWKSYACDSGGTPAFECTNCGKQWWSSGWGSRIQLDPENSHEIIRAMKLKKVQENLGKSHNYYYICTLTK